MNYLDRTYDDEYDELITFYPRYYRRVYEMDTIIRLCGAHLNNIMDDIDQVYLNAFIDLCDEETVEEFERFFWIGINRNLTLDERKRIIKSYMIGSGRISGTLIKEMVRTFVNATEASIEFKQYDEHGNHALFIDMKTEESLPPLLPPLRTLLRKKIPAHIYYTFEQDTNWGFDNRENMDLEVPEVEFGLRMDMTDTVYRNGSNRHNGEIFHRGHRNNTVNVGMQTGVSIEDKTETIGQITILSVSVGAFLHDGSYQHNGGKKHNSIFKKEVIE